MDIKNTPLQVKAAGPDDGLEEGYFEGYASVFGNVDSYGDIVDAGAFKRTLEEWATKGGAIPVLWGHDMQDPFANIGGLVSAEEDENGLKVSGQLDLENPTAAQVYRLMKGRRTNRMSFAYAVRDSEKRDDGLHLKDLDLFEVSVVQVPANDQAEILAVKTQADALTQGIKAGRVLAAKHIDSLRAAQEAIGVVIKAAEASNDQEKASVTGQAKDEEPTGAKSEEPRSESSVNRLAATIQFYERNAS